MAIYLAFYNKNSYANATEAKEKGGLYIPSSDISGGYTGLHDAISAVDAALLCVGMQNQIAMVYTDENAEVFNDPYDYQD